MVNNERIPVRIKERIKGMSKKRVEYEILLLFITIPLSLFNRGAPMRAVTRFSLARWMLLSLYCNL